MRDLIESAKHGPKALYVSLADFPHRHPLAISGFAGGLALVLVLFAPGGLVEQHEQINVQRTEITKIANLCGKKSLRPGANDSRVCAQRLRIALLNCRRYAACLNALASTSAFVPSFPKGVVAGSGSIPSGQPGGRAPPPSSEQPVAGHTEHHSQGGGGKPSPSPSQPPTSTPQPPPEEAPGHSGEAPGHTGENPGQGEGEPPGQEGSPPPGKGSVGGGVEGIVEGVGGVVEGTGEVVCGLLERLQDNCPK